jgi:hypothetical protein
MQEVERIRLEVKGREGHTLYGMVESHAELIMEIAKETRLDRIKEDAEQEYEEDEDADDGGDATAPPIPAPLAATPEDVVEEECPEEMVPE